MTVLAPHDELLKWRFPKSAVTVGDCLRASAMAARASRQDWTAEAVVAVLIARRQRPGIDVCIKRKRRLEQIIAALHNAAEAVCARADDPINLLRLAEDLFAVGSDPKVGLV